MQGLCRGGGKVARPGAGRKWRGGENVYVLRSQFMDPTSEHQFTYQRASLLGAGVCYTRSQGEEVRRLSSTWAVHGYCEGGREIAAEYGCLHVSKSSTVMQVNCARDVCEGRDRPRAK